MKSFIITEDEKTRILNLHEKFKKNELGLISEGVTDVEPVISGSHTYKIFFPEGDSKLTDHVKKIIKDGLRPLIKKSLPTIEKFYKNEKFKLPKFIVLGAGTSSTGSYGVNKNLAIKRIDDVKKVVLELMREFGINDEMSERFITTNSNYDYSPTSVDSNLYDRKLVKPLDKERFSYVTIKSLTTKGLNDVQLDDAEDDLMYARGSNINPDEESIVRTICKLKTYSDITSLDRKVHGLQDYVNQTITDNDFWNDKEERNKIVACLNSAAANSGKGKIAAMAGDRITIIVD
jgi:hypothetical protein